MSPITEFRPATGQERMYTYAQSQELTMKTGSIGYLRGDFGSSGKQFYTTWFDRVAAWKTQPFKDELDLVINTLRDDPAYHGILTGRSEMVSYCATQPDSVMEGNYTTEYAFRVSTAEYIYLMRLNPTRGDYNFYVCCYQKKWLDRHLQASGKGIRFITPHYKEKFRIPDGDRIRMIRSDRTQVDRTVRFIDDYHIEVGSGPSPDLYHICEWAERVEATNTKVIPLRSSLPQQCYTILPSTGEIVAVRRGESGCFPTELPDNGPDANREAVDLYNQRDGITRAQENAMFAGSCFGWETPAADPKNYTEDGVAIQPKTADRGDAR